MSSDLAIINLAVASPVAMAVILTYMYTKLASIEKELHELKESQDRLDKKIDRIVEKLGYVEGRVNGIQRRLDNS